MITSQNASGACEGTSDFGGEYILTHCKVSGNHYEFNIEVLSISYVSENSGTIEGNKVTGEFTDNFGHSFVEYTASRTATAALIAGRILDRNDQPAAGVTVTVSGTSEEPKEPVSKSVVANAEGRYSIEVPAGEYTATATGDPFKQYGGSLRVATEPGKTLCPGAAQEATCTIPRIAVGEEDVASFLYTQCGSAERLTNSKEPTGCPIIFVPGSSARGSSVEPTRSSSPWGAFHPRRPPSPKCSCSQTARPTPVGRVPATPKPRRGKGKPACSAASGPSTHTAESWPT